MLPSHQKRQMSLKNINNSKHYRSVYSPPKFLPTISEQRQIKKNNAKELSTVISRFMNLKKKDNEKNSEELLRSGLAVLKAFSVVQNNFQNLFLDLQAVFKQFTLAIDDSSIKAVLSKYRVREGSSYRKTCSLIDEEVQNMMKDRNEMIEELEDKVAGLERQLKEKKKSWREEREQLKEEVERYKRIANVEYVKSLQETVQKLKENLSDLQASNKLLDKTNEKLMIELDQKEMIIHDLKYDMNKLRLHLYDVDKKKEKVQQYFQNLKIRFDELLARMIGIKETIEKVEEENSNLVSQRVKLVKRAAVSFQELTPRPKYKEIFDIDVKSHINGTAQIFENLVEATNMEYKDITSKIILKKKNYKLQEAEAIRAKVVKDVVKAKEQMEQLK